MGLRCYVEVCNDENFNARCCASGGFLDIVVSTRPYFNVVWPFNEALTKIDVQFGFNDM